jgi:methylenetetrahydrofolate dehydrogenase (NADP+)/methenyltetrahydrofolate cyclohydrolase
MSKIIDGKEVAKKIRKEIQNEIEKLPQNVQKPGLAVILVGDNPASQSYVKMKSRACEEVGIHSITDHQSSHITEKQLLQLVNKYNQDTTFHGLLVQLPLPSHINEQKIIEAIHPEKDVDCFHPYNVGRLMTGNPIFEPATPSGIVELLKQTQIPTSGKHVVILGRSNIVGKPLGMMLVQKREYANAIVTFVHTAAHDITRYTKQADILIAAMGRPEVVHSNMIKEGVIIIDVGVNRVAANNEKGYQLVGDVAFDECLSKVSAITPVPGGVGPMTIAMLLKNTLRAFHIQQN